MEDRARQRKKTAVGRRPRPHTGEGAALPGVLLLAVLEVVALATAPRTDRPIVAGALVGAAAALFAVSAAAVRSRRRRRREAEAADGSWCVPDAPHGFPVEAVRPFLLAPGAPGPGVLSLAWTFAVHGHDAAWLARHLDLPTDLARLLADAAGHGRPPGHGTAPPR